LQVTTNADGTAAAEIDYQATEPGTYVATARWDNGPAETIVLDQPGEFWHELGIGSLYPMRHGLTSGQHTLEVTVTNADRGVSATTSAVFDVEVTDATPDAEIPIAGGDSLSPSDGFAAEGGESLAPDAASDAPTVTGVYVRGSTWAADFKDYLDLQESATPLTATGSTPPTSSTSCHGRTSTGSASDSAKTFRSIRLTCS